MTIHDKATVCMIYYVFELARRGGAEVAGLDFGSEDPGSVPRLPSPRVDPSDGKELKDVFGRPGARVEVGSAR